MHKLLICFSLLAFHCPPPVFADGTCPPDGYTVASLLELRQAEFQLADDETRNALAIALLACIGHANPEIRDGVAYEGLATWLRGEDLAADTLDTLYRRLVHFLGHDDDHAGFLKPFATLVLSEVARTDRVEKRFSTDRRAELVKVAASYLAGVRDYRGFSDTEGWRHGVAHGSDLVLQLVLNEETTASQLSELLSAVAGQVSPVGETFYIYGEPARLARPVFYAFRRGVLGQDYWEEWFESVFDPAPLKNWNDTWSSNAGLARRHNIQAFLMAMHLNASTLEDAQQESLQGLVSAALQRLQ